MHFLNKAPYLAQILSNINNIISAWEASLKMLYSGHMRGFNFGTVTYMILDILMICLSFERVFDADQ